MIAKVSSTICPPDFKGREGGGQRCCLGAHGPGKTPMIQGCRPLPNVGVSLTICWSGVVTPTHARAHTHTLSLCACITAPEA